MLHLKSATSAQNYHLQTARSAPLITYLVSNKKMQPQMAFHASYVIKQHITVAMTKKPLIHRMESPTYALNA